MVTWTTQPPGGAVYTTEATEAAATITLSELTDMRALRADLASSASGAELVASLQSGTGAASRTVRARLRDTVSVKDFGAIGDGTLHTVAEWIVPGALGRFTSLAALQVAYPHVTAATDSLDWAALQAALTYAGTLSVTHPEFSVSNYGYVLNGGTTVHAPAGHYRLSNASLVVPQNVSFEGDGKHSTVIQSSFDGIIMRNSGLATVTGTYDQAGMAFRNFCIIGDRTKTAQIGLAFLRLTSATVENVLAEQCGSHGWALYQCGVNHFSNIESIYNVGHGLLIQHGFNSFDDQTGTAYPSNANVFSFIRALANDGAGIYFGDGTNGNIFIGANAEYSGWTAGNNEGYNIHVATDSSNPNVFYALWTEGPVEAHVYIECDNSSVVLKLVDWRHFGNGSSGNVDRALIVNTGTAIIENASATATSYKTIAGSIAPFRIQNASTSIIRIVNSYGATVTGIGLVEDSTGATTGLLNNLKQDNGVIDGAVYGPRIFYTDGGAPTGPVAFQSDDEAYPWFQSRADTRDVLLGPGSSTADAGFKRLAAGQVGPRTGDFFNVGSAWNGSHLIMGAYHLWVDTTGALRIKSSAPASDTDGTVVGTQT